MLSLWGAKMPKEYVVSQWENPERRMGDGSSSNTSPSAITILQASNLNSAAWPPFPPTRQWVVGVLDSEGACHLLCALHYLIDNRLAELRVTKKPYTCGTHDEYPEIMLGMYPFYTCSLNKLYNFQNGVGKPLPIRLWDCVMASMRDRVKKWNY